MVIGADGTAHHTVRTFGGASDPSTLTIVSIVSAVPAASV